MTRSTDLRRGWRGCARALLTLGWLLAACNAEPDDTTGGETHFLRACQVSSECGEGLACLCGLCTRSCADSTTCTALPRGACASPPAASVCSAAPPQTFCDAPCATDGDCATLSVDHRCVGGRCRVEVPGGSGGAGADGTGGAGGAAACVRGEVGANQVVVIGDSYLGATHQITAYLEDRARTAGALAVGERYRDHSSILANALAFDGNGIAAQYAAAVAEADVEVVIMNGGGADVLLGSCATPTADCPLLVDASVAAEDLLARMAADGVRHVVYAFYPDPVDLGLRAKMDALRPLIEAVCLASPVPCHWVDLRTPFAGHYADYVGPDGVTPTASGSEASAVAIWAAMQASCVAQ